MSLTAIQTLKLELVRLQQAQSECITDEGFVRSEHKERYQMLVRKAKAIQESIEWLEDMYASTVNKGRA